MQKYSGKVAKFMYASALALTFKYSYVKYEYPYWLYKVLLLGSSEHHSA